MDPKKAAAATPTGPVWEKKAKNFAIGQDIQPKRDLSRYVKWPKYVRIQRQRKVLYQRLKVPPSINQFSNSLDKNLSVNLFRLLCKYKPEDKQSKKERMQGEAEKKEAGAEEDKKKPICIKFGINHITKLCEQKKAQLVVIAHDVDPIELVLWLPTLCKKMDVPYCIVKGKSRLGQLVHQKNAAALCLTSVKSEDQREFGKIVEAARSSFNDGARVQWGGGIMGAKNRHKMKVRAKILAKEMAQRSVVA